MRNGCERCDGEGWVCEAHHDTPFDGECCGAPGAPCPSCNPCDHVHPPRLPDGFNVEHSVGMDEGGIN